MGTYREPSATTSVLSAHDLDHHEQGRTSRTTPNGEPPEPGTTGRKSRRSGAVSSLMTCWDGTAGCSMRRSRSSSAEGSASRSWSRICRGGSPQANRSSFSAGTSDRSGTSGSRTAPAESAHRTGRTDAPPAQPHEATGRSSRSSRVLRHCSSHCRGYVSSLARGPDDLAQASFDRLCHHRDLLLADAVLPRGFAPLGDGSRHARDPLARLGG